MLDLTIPVFLKENGNLKNGTEGSYDTEFGCTFDKLYNDPRNFFRDGKINMLLGGREHPDNAIRFLREEGIFVSPDQTFQEEKFGFKSHGETGWYVYEAAENAAVYYGFNRDMTETEILEIAGKAKNSEDPMAVWTPYLNRIPVKQGDVFFMIPGLVHGMTEGLTVIEIQEYETGTLKTKDLAAGVHHMKLAANPLPLVDKQKRVPYTYKRTADGEVTSLLAITHTLNFSVIELNVHGTMKALETASYCFVLDGEGKAIGNWYEREIKKGDLFFLPYPATGISFTGNVKVMMTYAGLPDLHR